MKRTMMFLVAAFLMAMTLSSCVWVGGHGYYRRPHAYGYYHDRYHDEGHPYRGPYRGHPDRHRERPHHGPGPGPQY